MKSNKLLAWLPALLLAASVVVTAQPTGPGPQRLMKDLDLTEAQTAKLKDLQTAHMKAMTDLQANVKKAGIDLRSLMTADNPDKSAIKAKMKDVADLRLKVADARVDHLFEVRSVLTPEQQKKWKGLRQERWGEMRGRRMMRPGRPGRGEMPMHDGPGRMERRQERIHN